MKALIIFNLCKTGAATLSAKIADILRGAGITPCVFGENIIYAEKVGAEIVSSPASCSYIITVGGDGTILRWGKVAADYDIPLLGVNLGRLGFMASVETEEIGKIPELLSGEHHISRRMMLNVELIRDGETAKRRHSFEKQPLKAAGICRELRRNRGFAGTRGRNYSQHAHGLNRIFPLGGRSYPVARPRMCGIYGALPAHLIQQTDDFFG